VPLSDGGVFKNTNMYNKLESKTLNIPAPSILQIPYLIEVSYMILADKAFALNKYTMKPFEDNPERGSIQRIFNYRLSRGYRVVKNVFGILSIVFRVLRKPILLEPEKAFKILLATIYLHNFLCKRSTSQQTYTPPGTFNTEKDCRRKNDQEMTSLLPIRNVLRRTTSQVKNICLHLAEHFVMNGAIPWQNNY
jgi:hypothetical protein